MIAQLRVRAARARLNESLLRTAFIFGVTYLILGFLDVVSTNAALAAGFVEGNPLMRMAQHNYGEYWPVPKLSVHAASAGLALWYPGQRMLACFSILILYYVFVVTSNFSLVLGS